MYRTFIATLLVAMAAPLLAFSADFSPLEDTVTYVIDGDTFVTKSGKTIRLLNINTPETGKKGKPSQPYADKAKEVLTELVAGKNVTLKFQSRLKDKYRR
jgi:endonuclease YncB( thermonuclease family)